MAITLPFTAVAVAVVFTVTFEMEEPTGIVTLAGGMIAFELDESLTVIDPLVVLGAALSLIVAVEVVPPGTEDGDNVTELTWNGFTESVVD